MAITKVPKVMTEGLEESSNKSTDTNLGTSNTLYPSQNAVKVYTDTQISNVTPTSIGLGNVTNDAQLKRAAGDFNSFAGTIPATNDIVLIEDASDSFNKKKIFLYQIFSSLQAVTRIYAGNGASTIFYFDQGIYTTRYTSDLENGAIGVYVNGLRQRPGVDYTFGVDIPPMTTTADYVEFTTAPALGADIILCFIPN